MKNKIITFFVWMGILILGFIIGFFVAQNETIYDFPNLNFVSNVTHGDIFKMLPEDIIISYRIHCKSYKENGDVIDINMCEECWEGVDCYQKTWDTVYHYTNFLKQENIRDNATDFCDKIVESGFYIITWEELRDYRSDNDIQDSYIAYNSLFDKKCKTNLTIFNVEV